MVNIEQRVLSGSPPNEDYVWTDDGAAIVLDGATGLTDATYTDAESDGRWYVETLSHEIQQRIATEKSLARVVEASIGAVSDRFEELTGAEKPEKHERPSGAGAVIRWQGEMLEYFVLGDCSVILETEDGTIPVLGKGPRDLDNQVVDRIESIRAESTEPVSYTEVRERVDDMLVKHRRMMNEEDGYWTLGQTPEAVRYAQTNEIPKGEIEELIAFTDGFEVLVPTYNVFVDWEGLLQYISYNGLDRAIKTLRAFEQADPECRAYPRLKPSDDIGVIHIDFDR
jgi:hypothetical protein